MIIECINCEKEFRARTHSDIIVCPRCGKRTPTGLEDDIREIQEAYRNSLRWPRATVGRAIAYSSAIYRFATHGDPVDIEAIEHKVHKADKSHPPAEAGKVMWSGRHGAGVDDDSCGLMFIPLSGKTAKENEGGQKPWHVLYIVFRGSRGSKQSDEGGRKWYKPWERNEPENPEGAGWGKRKDGRSINVDWRSNFNNSQVSPPWAVECMLHRGFFELYWSMRAKIQLVVRLALAEQPKTRVVVTGHSLGAALATVCAHDLEHSGLCRPFCFPFCAPRVGGLNFVRDFDIRIATRTAPLDCEFDRASYHRSFVFVQSNDPVSWGGKHGFKHKMTEKEARKYADSGNIVKQGLFAALKKDDPLTIYYHVGNLYRASYFGLHDFNKMEKELLG